MGHSHGHDHGHSHQHGAGSTRTRLAVAFGVTSLVLVIGVIGAWITGSLALLVDAAHMLTDAGGLLVALIAATLALRPASGQRTWGWLRAEVLAAGAQATVLLGVGIFALVEGVRRWQDPPEIAGGELLIFGIIGLAGNLVSLLVLLSGRKASLNMRAAFLEVLNDALGSVAVIISAIVITTTGWTRADAVAGIAIALLIIPRAFVILKEAGSVLLETAPKGLDVEAVREHMERKDGVIEVHDLHATRIDTRTVVVTAHVVIEAERFHDGTAPQILDALQHCLTEHLGIPVDHATIQLEPPEHQGHEPELSH